MAQDKKIASEAVKDKDASATVSFGSRMASAKTKPSEPPPLPGANKQPLKKIPGPPPPPPGAANASAKLAEASDKVEPLLPKPVKAAATSAAPPPPPVPEAKQAQAEKPSASEPPRVKVAPQKPETASASSANDEANGQRRLARRRPAGPVRNRIAANDDAPSIGGLIYALEQKPSNKPFVYAGIASVVWSIIALGFGYFIVSAELNAGSTFVDVLSRPTTFLSGAAVVVPVAVLWFLALLAWRSEELRLRSSTMTEVAVRLAEPDRMAEQSVASLGQAVRRQVSFMNDAVSRALGRAGELEALVHHEVSELERSYEVNERKIRALITELTGERHALLDTSDKVSESLSHLGKEIPELIETLSKQQINLAGIIKGAGDNLTALESAVGSSATRLETALGGRTEQMQTMLENYTTALSSALGSRTEQMQSAFENYMENLDQSLGARTDTLQAVFEEYAKALDTTLSNRAQALDIQLVERTKSLDEAFNERLRLFDESIMRSTLAIDGAVAEKSQALTSALDNHAKTFSETITRQAHDLDESLMHGINSVRRSSENITRQSLKAIEGLAGQSDMLRNVSENLLAQVNTVTNRFENQGQAILHAANSLESANFKIDATLQQRHAELSRTLDQMSGKADEFGRYVQDYSSNIDNLSSAEQRTRSAADDLQRSFTAVSSSVDEQLSSLKQRVELTSEDARRRSAKTAAEVQAEQAWIREQLDKMPAETRENASAMRNALQEQLRALEHLSTISGGRTRDVAPPLPSSTLTGAYQAEARPGPAGPPPRRRLPSPPAGGAPNQGPTPSAPMPQGGGLRGAPPVGPSTPPQQDPREAWSLGDLLARASRDEGHDPGSIGGRWQTSFPLNIEVIARSIDPSTTAAIWSRLRAGQRGVMVRSIYSPDGRAAFDEVARRYQSDPELRATIDRYLVDFERLQKEADMKDPTGRSVQAHLVSDTGRVYLFLAHASGRIA